MRVGEQADEIVSETALLQAESIHELFPGVKAPQGMGLELRAGEAHALLGGNGASESTLVKVLGGIYIVGEGRIFIGRQKVTIDRVNVSHNNEISIIYQELVLVPHMTMAENIFPGREPSKGLRVSHEIMEKETQQLLDTYHASIDTGALVKGLTIAQQQMVEIVRVISYHSKILVMDEPTSSISDKGVESLLGTMRELIKKGVGITCTSHKMDELKQICDRVTVSGNGTYVSTEWVKDTTRDHLVAMMVGRKLTRYYTRDYMEPGQVVLRCENITNGKIVKGASFGLRGGEIIGFIGLMGAGRSETMKYIFGLTPGYTGEISVDGGKATIKSPIDAMKLNVALVPGDRKQEGLCKVQSVRFNPTIKVLKSFIKDIQVDADKEEEITRQHTEMMDAKVPSQEQLIGNLPGDNQQKVMIRRWLATAPKMLILDESTRGVDVGAKSKVYRVMNELMKKDVFIVMVSSELLEILSMSNRVYVMYDDRITGRFSHEECIAQEQIARLAAR